MRWMKLLLLLAFTAAGAAHAESAKIVKVLPYLLDAQGRHTLKPSLYDRDYYQAQLRKNPGLRGGLRFDVQWRSRGYANVKLRVEARGNLASQPTQITLEQPVKKGGLFGNWSSIALDAEACKKFGDLTAWRATLWNGDKQIAEQKSFLW